MKAVQQMEEILTTKRYELGMGGGRNDIIEPSNVRAINAIITSYIQKGLLVDGSKVEDGAKYTTVTLTLMKIISASKSFLAFNSTDQFSKLIGTA